MFYELIPLRQFRANTPTSANTLIYSAPASAVSLIPGQIVSIPLGRNQTAGIITRATSKQPDFATKPISRLLYDQPLPHHLLKSILWLSEYYFTPLPAVASTVLPTGITKHRRAKITPPSALPKLPLIDLNSAQKQALRELQGKNTSQTSPQPLGATKLLHGVTGSGKTNIYLTLALEAFKRHQSTILLVPEIALTSQLVQVFEQTFGSNVVLIHSRQTESTRHQIWEQLLYLSAPCITEGSAFALASAQNTVKNSPPSAILRAHDDTLPDSTMPDSPKNATISDSLGNNTALDALENTTPQIVIGPRSALFAPLFNLGLIIIDEAHESTFYQDTVPRYSALRLASYMVTVINRAHQTKSPQNTDEYKTARKSQGTSKCETAKKPQDATNIANQNTKSQNTNKHKAKEPALTTQNLPATAIFGTATPLVADYYLANQQHSLVTLTKKAKTTAIQPEIKLIDLRNRQYFTRNPHFSTPLLQTIATNLKNNHQTLIFHNRRGSAPLTICEHCGWQALCSTCFLPLTLHTDAYKLVCHACGYTMPVPQSCPSCEHLGIIHKGFGTKLLAEELKTLFPRANIARYDADNAKSHTLDAEYADVKSGKVQIIIGTQTITKGLDLPHLASVGVIQADTGLALPDYSAEERTFHLLTQVIGRVGRGHIPTASCIIQTYQPDHPVIKYALTADYANFYRYLLKKRHLQHFPPFAYLAKITVTYKTEATTLKHIQNIHRQLTTTTTPDIIISAPTPAFHEHTTRGYTWQLLLRSRSRTALTNLLKSLTPSKNLQVTLDPPSLL